MGNLGMVYHAKLNVNNKILERLLHFIL
jgi:hypothetical protein